MSRLLTFASTVLLGLAMLAPAASAQRGHVFIRGGFGWNGPGWGWYAPYSYWGPYGYYGEGYGANYPGQVKIVTQNKDAQVYVDGGYAGTAGKLKKFKLMPGQHDIELRDSSGKTLHGEVITVIPGKTVDFDADLTPPKK
jgi:opacity protein-like surface antigen